MNNPEVEVRDITSERAQLISTASPKEVDLGGKHSVRAALTEVQVNCLLQAMRQHHQHRVFLLRWEGNKIPRGAKILGHEIGWTQNGIVTTTDGRHIGSYDRVVEFGGDSGNEQQMIVYITDSAAEISTGS